MSSRRTRVGSSGGRKSADMVHPSGSSAGGSGGFQQPGRDREATVATDIDAGGVQGVLAERIEQSGTVLAVFQSQLDARRMRIGFACTVVQVHPAFLKGHVVGFARSLADTGHGANFDGIDGDFDHDVPRLMLPRLGSDGIMLTRGVTMEYGIALIDRAGKMCGSFYKLHKETGYPQSHISEIRSGKRALPLEWVPVLAEIAGEDPRDALARVMAERLPEGSRARAILGGVRAAGVVALLLLCVVCLTLLPSTGYARTTQKVDFVYIVEYWRCIASRNTCYCRPNGISVTT